LRRLTLRKETVSELTPAELDSVVGGGNTQKICVSGIVQCVTFRCVTEDSCTSLAGC
jgi:hypothetical protein